MTNNMFFPPYIGSEYGKSDNALNGQKILVIGNSHYCDQMDGDGCGAEKCRNYEEGCHDFTSDVVRNRYLKYQKGESEFGGWMNTYTKFANCLSDSKKAPAEVWQAIAFYNFLQRAVREQNTPGTEDEKSLSAPLVYEAIRATCPNLIVVWAYDKVFANLPKDGLQIDAQNNRAGIYNIDGHRIPIVCTYHPASSRFSPSDWHKELMRYLK